MKAEKKQTDRRIRRTQNNLKKALLSLLQTKNINEISIRELAELADINRGTFYLHYRDPYDLLRQLSEQFLAELQQLMEDNSHIGTYPSLCRLYHFIYTNHELLHILLGVNGDILFQNSLEKMLIKNILEQEMNTSSLNNYRTLEYYTTFVVSGWVAIIRNWLDNGMKESPEEIALMTMHITGQLGSL